MYLGPKKGERIFVPEPRASFAKHEKKTRWLNIGSAIILISIIVAIAIVAWVISL